jgi:hypothetical protein
MIPDYQQHALIPASRYLGRDANRVPLYYIPLSNQATPWDTALIEKLALAQLVYTFPETSLPCSQEPATGPNQETNPVHVNTTYFLKLHFNTILQSVPDLKLRVIKKGRKGENDEAKRNRFPFNFHKYFLLLML